MINVLLADDHILFAEGLRSLLDRQVDISVSAVVRDGRTAVLRARQDKPDVLVMDISMPVLNGIDATRQVSALPGGPRVVCLSMHADERFVSAALDAGASGYVLKDCESDELLRAIREVNRGRSYLSPAVASVVVDRVRSGAKGEAAADPPLSGREREVLQLIAEGRDTAEIAGKLNVSPKTVATHRSNLMDKLCIHSIAGLTKYAIRQGLTTVGPNPGE